MLRDVNFFARSLLHPLMKFFMFAFRRRAFVVAVRVDVMVARAKSARVAVKPGAQRVDDNVTPRFAGLWHVEMLFNRPGSVNIPRTAGQSGAVLRAAPARIGRAAHPGMRPGAAPSTAPLWAAVAALLNTLAYADFLRFGGDSRANRASSSASTAASSGGNVLTDRRSLRSMRRFNSRASSPCMYVSITAG